MVDCYPARVLLEAMLMKFFDVVELLPPTADPTLTGLGIVEYL